MEPYHQDDRITLYHGDALAVLAALPDAEWWHQWAMRAAEIRLFRKRVRFVGSGQRAPFPSALLVFRSGWSGSPVLTAVGIRAAPVPMPL